MPREGSPRAAFFFSRQAAGRNLRANLAPHGAAGKEKHAFLDPNHSAGRFRGAILVSPERREGFAARFLSLPGGGKVSRRDSCPTQSRGKELSHDSCPTRSRGKELSHDSCPTRSRGKENRTILAPRGAAGSWRQRTILSHGNSWHVFGGKMTGRASKRYMRLRVGGFIQPLLLAETRHATSLPLGDDSPRAQAETALSPAAGYQRAGKRAGMSGSPLATD